MTEEFPGLDLGKFLCALLVMSIHCGGVVFWDGPWNNLWINGLARIAVPFFFMAAGFFFTRSLMKRGRTTGVLLHYLKRVGVVFAVWTLIYLPMAVLTQESPVWASSPQHLARFLYDGLVGGVVYHLWYFPALIVTVTLFFVLYEKVPWGGLLLVGIVLYGFALVGDSYYGVSRALPLVAPLVDFWEWFFKTTRNVLPASFLPLVLGGWCARFPPLRLAVSGPLFFLFLVLTLVEVSLITSWGGAKDFNTSLFLIPTSFFFFVWAKGWFKDTGKSRKELRDLSLLVFCLHPLPLTLFSVACAAWGLTVPNTVMFGVDLVATLIISLLIVRTPWKVVSILY